MGCAENAPYQDQNFQLSNILS